LSSFTQMPTSGRFRMMRIRLPIHMLAISPQKRAGCSTITEGPGVMPLIINAASMSAMVALPGTPNVSVGMNAHCEAALLADSGPANPSIAP